ncbi:hypothetical protein NQ318_023363 [Aromia moschata]|uniref:HTH psq-type domain-containing protein n=1 Tax=Aromia moschata TaxID=1265417 RepID=A0AAV8XBG6_9CUCU|nr:hypothetical protein NQ318_023363 [Aromia moschata]
MSGSVAAVLSEPAVALTGVLIASNLNEKNMVRTYKRKQNVSQRNYSDEDLRIAVNDVKAGRLTIYRASREYNFSYPTVYTNVRGSRGKYKRAKGRPTCLPFTEEEKLANGLKTLEKCGFGLTRKEVLKTVGEYVRSNNIKTSFKDGTPGEDWFIGFKKRH